MKNKLLFGILFAVCNLCSLWFVGQYLLQRPRAALDISLPVHLSQTASATIGTACRNLHPEVDFLQRYCPFGGLGEVLLPMECIVYGAVGQISVAASTRCSGQ